MQDLYAVTEESEDDSFSHGSVSVSSKDRPLIEFASRLTVSNDTAETADISTRKIVNTRFFKSAKDVGILAYGRVECDSKQLA